MRDGQFVYKSRRSTLQQQHYFVEKLNRIFGEKRLTGTEYFDMDKAFDVNWID
jgi:hypothetical protein